MEMATKIKKWEELNSDVDDFVDKLDSLVTVADDISSEINVKLSDLRDEADELEEEVDDDGQY